MLAVRLDDEAAQHAQRLEAQLQGCLSFWATMPPNVHRFLAALQASMPRILRNLRINEVSGVDKGAGRGVKIMLMKRDDDDAEIDWSATKREFSAKERQDRADSGHAMPGGGFPIDNKQDLRNAVQAIGRAKNPAAAKAHIKRRARALGATDLIPDTWKRDSDGGVAVAALSESLRSILADDGLLNKAEKLTESWQQFLEFMQETDMPTSEDIEKLVADAVAKALDEFSKKKPPPPMAGDGDDDKDQDKKKLGDGKVGGKGNRRDPTHDSTGPDIDDVPTAGRSSNKRDDSRDTEMEKRYTDLEKRNVELEKMLNGLITDKRQAEFRKRAVDAHLKEEDGALMLKAFDGDPESQHALLKRYDEVIKSLKSQIKTSVVFGEFGKGGSDAPSSAMQELEAKAADLRKVKPELSQAQAFNKVYTDPANRELVSREKAESANRLAKIAAATGQ